MCYVVLSFPLRNVIAQREDREGGGGGGGGGGTSTIKPQVCSINLSRLKPTLVKVSGETRCSVDVWNPFKTHVKPVLLCSVDRGLISGTTLK